MVVDQGGTPEGSSAHPQRVRRDFRAWLLAYADDFKGLPTFAVKGVLEDIAELVEVAEDAASYATKPRRGGALTDPLKNAALAELADVSPEVVARSLRVLVAAGWVVQHSPAKQGRQARYAVRVPRDMRRAARAFLACFADEYGLTPKSNDRARKARARKAAYRVDPGLREYAQGTVQTVPPGDCADSPLEDCADSPPGDCADSPPLPLGRQVTGSGPYTRLALVPRG